MSFVKKACVPVLLLSVLNACTTTSDQTKTIADPKGNPVAYTTEKAVRLSDVYDATEVYKPATTLPTLVDGSVPSGQALLVEMGADFGRKFQLCNDADVCKEVRPISRGKKDYGEDADQLDESIIGNVTLSDATSKLFGVQIPAQASGKKILIMEPDVELSVLTAGGLLEPSALWTSAASGYVTELTAQYFQKLGHNVTLYKEGANGVSETTGQALINLHEAVGKSIFLYQYAGLFQLPTRAKGQFDWKLGKTTKDLSKAYGADLGLFIHMRDSYSSGSRVAAQLLMSALFSVHIPGGQQVGFVSLVDLKSGEIVWYNRLFSDDGDLRTFGAALHATDSLLKDIPL